MKRRCIAAPGDSGPCSHWRARGWRWSLRNWVIKFTYRPDERTSAWRASCTLTGHLLETCWTALRSALSSRCCCCCRSRLPGAVMQPSDPTVPSVLGHSQTFNNKNNKKNPTYLCFDIATTFTTSWEANVLCSGSWHQTRRCGPIEVKSLLRLIIPEWKRLSLLINTRSTDAAWPWGPSQAKVTQFQSRDDPLLLPDLLGAGVAEGAEGAAAAPGRLQQPFLCPSN